MMEVRASEKVVSLVLWQAGLAVVTNKGSSLPSTQLRPETFERTFSVRYSVGYRPHMRRSD